jgi:hypothetical protein
MSSSVDRRDGNVCRAQWDRRVHRARFARAMDTTWTNVVASTIVIRSTSRIVDLGEENNRNLKLPSDVDAEATGSNGIETIGSFVHATTQMGERLVKVNET